MTTSGLANFKQLLNVFTVVTCGFSKVPQILSIVRLQTTEGLSFLNLNLELITWTMSFAYFTFHGYPHTDYLEYPLLLLQQLVIIILHLRCNKIANLPGILAFLGCYLLIIFWWIHGPAWFLQILISINPPISSVGKLFQVHEIIKTNRGDLVSIFPYATTVFTSSARLLTVWIESQDINLYISFGLSVFLNICVVITALVFRPPSPKPAKLE